ncbi:hypothetical protein M404DRAFT_1002622, partial [Pisolithus tinctorius Marx 270]
VYVLATPDLCKRWNSERTDGKAYALETLANLLQRFEEPSAMVRWGSSLFTVSWTGEDVPADDIWRAITKGIVNPNTGTQAVVKAPTDALLTLEHTAASVASALVSEQANSGSLGGTTTVTLTPMLQVCITLRLQNKLKRRFVTLHKKAITLGTTEKGAVDWSEQSVADKFVAHLEENMKP